MCSQHKIRGRLAPSPTGFLHLGNAWSFLLAWLAARSSDGAVIMRIEDIDPDRSRTHYSKALQEDLRWLGLDWDEGPDIGGPSSPYEQSSRLGLYEKALAGLEAEGHVYQCFCTRKELRTMAGAPHPGDIGAPYSGRCQNLGEDEICAHKAAGRKFSSRLRCPSGKIEFNDLVCGPQCMTLAECGGDFALRRSDGVFAYQLAVSCDDAAMGINQVVRGNDLLWSTPRQIALFKLLGAPIPEFAHVPMLLDAEGQRLAKRHESLTLRTMREAGTRAENIVGELACLAGLRPGYNPITPAELVPLFNFSLLPKAARIVGNDILERLV